MIILDEESSKHDIVAGTTTVRFPDLATVSSRPSSFLPDYETSQALNLHSFDKPRSPSRFGRFWTDSKFWRGTLYALVIYVALTIAIGIPLIVTKTKSSYPPSQQAPQVRVAWDGQNLQLGDLDAMPLLAMDNSTACNQWTSQNDDTTNSNFSASLERSFSLSVTESFSIQSNLSCDSPGPVGVRGNLTFDYNTDPSVPTISFVLSLQSTSFELRQKTYVCFTDVDSNKSLLIYVPDNISSNDSLSFSVNVLFPHPKQTITYCDFATYLPFFSHHFGDLSNTTFGSFAIQGAQSDLTFESLYADRLSVKNSFAGISGKFRATSSLNLDNIEGPVSADVTMDQQSGQPPPVFQIGTGNGPLRTNILLVSTSSAGYGSFVGQIQNFNAPVVLDVSYSSSTPSATSLGLSIFNSQADTNITMDAKWSGSFDIQTKLASVQLIKGQSPRDPSGKNQPWTVTYLQKSQSQSRNQGWVGWGTMPSNAVSLQSHLQVVSSLEPIVLHLGADPS